MKRLILASAFFVAYAYAATYGGQPATPLQIVTQERARFGPLLTPVEAPVLLQAVASRLGATLQRPFGLLVKTSGNNCGGYSCDVVCDSTHVYDVLTDGPDSGDNPDRAGTAVPAWPGESDDPLSGRRCDLVASGYPEPPVSQFDPTPIYREIDALRAEVNDVKSLAVEIEHLRRVASEQRAQIESLQVQIAALNERLNAIVIPEQKCVVGKVWGVFTVRSCPEL